MTGFKPKFNILPPSQMELWPDLAPLAEAGFVLYGGTALGLRLGHRTSVDFDFFTDWPLAKDALFKRLPFLKRSQIIQDEPETLTVLAPYAGDNIKISFFGHLGIGRVSEPEYTEDRVCQVASILDVCGTKMNALLQRIEVKDYRDVIAILKSGVPLARGLGAAKALFGKQFQPAESLKALTYFEGGDLDKLSGAERLYLIEAAAAVQTIEHIDLISQTLSETE